MHADCLILIAEDDSVDRAYVRDRDVNLTGR